MKIIKRDGREVPFDRNKIEAALAQASADVPTDALSRVEIEQLTSAVEKKCAGLNRAVTVEEVQDITLWVNSPGGNVFAAAEIYTMLRDYPGNVTVRIASIAASAASVVAMAGNLVQMSPTALIMIHDPSTIAMGNAKDMEKAITTLNEVKESIINAYAYKTGLTRNRISKLMSDETWLNAKKAVELGFADEILFENKPKPEEEPEEPEEENPDTAGRRSSGRNPTKI